MVSSASVVVELGIGESFPLLLEPRPKLDRPSRLKIPGTITADPDPCTTRVMDALAFRFEILCFGFPARCFIAKVLQRIPLGLVKQILLRSRVHNSGV